MLSDLIRASARELCALHIHQDIRTQYTLIGCSHIRMGQTAVDALGWLDIYKDIFHVRISRHCYPLMADLQLAEWSWDGSLPVHSKPQRGAHLDALPRIPCRQPAPLLNHGTQLISI